MYVRTTPQQGVARILENAMHYRTLIASLMLISLTSVAAALERPNSLKLTCGQAKDSVKHNGVVIMYTGANIYQRVVANAKGCKNREVLDPYFTKTKDKRSCRVGYHCRRLDEIW
jgi:hypothetical protein